MRRRIRRAMDVVMLGLMAERALNDPHEEIYFKNNGQADVLRVDAFLVLTPKQADVIDRVWERGSS